MDGNKKRKRSFSAFGKSMREATGGPVTPEELGLQNQPEYPEAGVNSLQNNDGMAARVLAKLAGRAPRNPLQTGGYSSSDYERMAQEMAKSDLEKLLEMSPPRNDFNPNDMRSDIQREEALAAAKAEFARAQELKQNQQLADKFVEENRRKYLDQISRGNWPQR